jgi:hypothetical protein
VNGLRMAPVTVARRSHDLPAGAVHRQRHSAGEATFGMDADRARTSGNRR